MPFTSKVTSRGQVTIPQELREKLHLEEGSVVMFEFVEGRIHLIPTALIPADQAWFWTKEHQKKEQEADEDLKHKRYDEFSSVDDLIGDLKRGSKHKKAS